MLFSKYLEERRSVRDYKRKTIDENTLEKISYYAGQIESNYGDGKISFKLFEDGKKVFDILDGHAGYAGVMIKSPHYIGLQISSKEDMIITKSAYCLEALIAKSHEFGVSSCWISLNDVKDEVKNKLVDEGFEMDYIISIGYSNEGGIFKQKSTSERLAIDEFVYALEWGKNASIGELEARGLMGILNSVRNAPSNKNLQPWRFILTEDRVKVCALNPEEKSNLIDVGVMMLYFERVANEYGISSHWRFEISEYKSNAEDRYVELGEFFV